MTDSKKSRIHPPIILVGNDNSTKSNLMSFCHSAYSAVGEVPRSFPRLWELSVPPSDVISLWEFRGEDDSLAFERIVARNRMVVLLVVEESDKEAPLQAIEHWKRRLDAIAAGTHEPRLLVLAQKHDVVDERWIDRSAILQEFPDFVFDVLELELSDKHQIRELIEAITGLSQDLRASVTRVRQLSKAADHIERLLREGKRIIEYVELFRKQRLSRMTIDDAIRRMHDLGSISYFEQNRVNEYVILDRLWMANAVAQVFADDEARERRGVLEYARLDTLWSPDQLHSELDPKQLATYVQEVMEVFGLCLPILDDERCLLPALLPFEEPAEAMSRWNRAREEEASLRCQLEDPGPELMAKIITRTFRHTTGTHWRSGALLQHRDSGDKALIRLAKTTQLEISCRGTQPTVFLETLRDSLGSLFEGLRLHPQWHEASSATPRQGLIELGLLTASVAHQLKSPTVATAGNARELQTAIEKLMDWSDRLAQNNLLKKIHDLIPTIESRHTKTVKVDSRDRFNAKKAISRWLEENHVESPWTLAPIFAREKLTLDDIKRAAHNVPSVDYGDFFGGLAAMLTINTAVRDIQSSAQQSENLLRLIQNFGRSGDPAYYEIVDVAESIQSAVERLTTEIGLDDVSIDVKLPPHRIKVKGQTDLLVEVWFNLIKNSIDAFRERRLEDPRVEVTLDQAEGEGRAASVTIRDNGPGIPPNVKSRLFEPFASSKSKGNGTGLGLYFARRIAKDHGGDVRLLKTGPDGATFAITLGTPPAAN
ncbi:MAG: COR domain-containing protein [Planctomycetota bacterium]